MPRKKDWNAASGRRIDASYARQAKDDTLLKTAERIQARAIRRCGELLKQIPVSYDRGNQHGDRLRDATVPQPTRSQAAADAGLSERQKKTALRVATVPDEVFEDAVESYPQAGDWSCYWTAHATQRPPWQIRGTLTVCNKRGFADRRLFLATDPLKATTAC